MVERIGIWERLACKYFSWLPAILTAKALQALPGAKPWEGDYKTG